MGVALFKCNFMVGVGLFMYTTNRVAFFALLSTLIASVQLYNLQAMMTYLEPGQKIVISVPATSLWTEPTESLAPYNPPLLSKDIPTHDSQLLYGERALVTDITTRGWVKIIACEQPDFNRSTGEWGFCEGWIKANHALPVTEFPKNNVVISSLWTFIYNEASNYAHHIATYGMGTLLQGVKLDPFWTKITLLNGSIGYVKNNDISYLKAIDGNKIRNLLVKRAYALLASPYVWGGRSSFIPWSTDSITSIDCSSLVDLVYRSCSMNIPRNSHAQFVKATPINPKDLQTGDLVFLKLAEHNFARVSHVMFYAGHNSFVEATGMAGVCTTRIVSAQDRFGLPIEEMTQGMKVCVNGCTFEVYAGSFLSSEERIQTLQQAFKS